MNLGHVLECGSIFGDRKEQRIRDRDERNKGEEEKGFERQSHGEEKGREMGLELVKDCSEWSQWTLIIRGVAVRRRGLRKFEMWIRP